MSFRYLSLFTGMGLFDYGLDAAGWECVGQCELSAWRRHWLQWLYGDLPRWDDIRAVGISGPPLPEVDWVCGGFPCQDASVAGKGAGLDGDRTGLWWEMHRVVRLIRPRGVIAENVPGLRARGLDRVLGSLEELGYTCRTFNIGAETVGAPHRRRRLFIIARLADTEGERRSGEGCGGIKDGQHDCDRKGVAHTNSDTGGQQSGRVSGSDGAGSTVDRHAEQELARGCPAQDDYGRWLEVLRDRPELAPATAKSAFCGVDDGLAPRTVGRLRRELLSGLGDAVQAEVAFAVGVGVKKWCEELG